MASTLLLASTGCRPMEEPVEQTPHTDTARQSLGVDKPLPNFPLHYRGAGRFRHADIPSFQLVANYTFDMEKGVNHEFATFIEHEVEIFNVYDMDPSDGGRPGARPARLLAAGEHGSRDAFDALNRALRGTLGVL